MRLVRVRGIHAGAWDALVMSSPGGGHFLQSFAWGTVKRRFHWRPYSFVLRDDGGGALGTALVLAYHTPLGRGLLYCPKGPWIDWGNRQSVDATLTGLRDWGRRRGAFALRFDPPVPREDAAARALLRMAGAQVARWEMQYRTGWVVDLKGTEAELLAAMKAKTRYNVRLAERKGVRAVYDHSAAALDAFHAMYALTAARDGFAPRPREYIKESVGAMVRSGNGALIWAEHESRRLAAIVTYAFGAKAWYWLGASSTEDRQLMPAYLAQWEGMRWARNRGCTRYDMTGVPDSDTLNEDDPFWGLYRFKSGFGGAPEDLVGTCELTIDPVVNAVWQTVEPIYYRLYQRIRGDVYY